MKAFHQRTQTFIDLPDHIAEPLRAKGDKIMERGNELVSAGNVGPELAGLIAELRATRVQIEDAIERFMATAEYTEQAREDDVAIAARLRSELRDMVLRIPLASEAEICVITARAFEIAGIMQQAGYELRPSTLRLLEKMRREDS